jgi:DNA-directed RNA polymerase alpha subunit
MSLSFKCPHCGTVTTYTGLVEAPPEPEPEDKYKSLPIRELFVSNSMVQLVTRALTCLHYADIETVDQLIRLTPKQLYRLKNLGPKTFSVIIAALESKGLSLAPGPLPWQLNRSAETLTEDHLLTWP